MLDTMKVSKYQSIIRRKGGSRAETPLYTALVPFPSLKSNRNGNGLMRREHEKKGAKRQTETHNGSGPLLLSYARNTNVGQFRAAVCPQWILERSQARIELNGNYL